jgi:iron complex transport system permease protein
MGERPTLKRSFAAAPAVVTIAVLGIALAALVVYTITVGAYPITTREIFEALGRALNGNNDPATSQIDTVLFSVRIPRIAAALLVGAALAAAGTVYQGLFRNPLVSPDILGVSTGAGLGAATGILLSLPVVAIHALAFAGGLATVALVYMVASAVRTHEPTLVLVLAGVVLGTLAGACISLVKILADPYDQLPAITFWLLGSLASIKPQDVWSTLPAVGIGLVPLVLLRWRMNLMALGDEEATALGVDPRRLRALFITAATLMTASVVAIAGVVGWVGLVMPHIARLVVGPNFDRLLPTAMLMGAGYLLIVDTLGRTLAETEIPLGILTAFLGAPVFLWLLATGRRGW